MVSLAVLSAVPVQALPFDGGALSAGGGLTPTNVASDFAAAPGRAYFVSAPATCSLPPAASAAGKEILVCNKTLGGLITYTTSGGETISGQPSGTYANATRYRVDRFISDGSNWYRE
jgi:hypothetical protein